MRARRTYPGEASVPVSVLVAGSMTLPHLEAIATWSRRPFNARPSTASLRPVP